MKTLRSLNEGIARVEGWLLVFFVLVMIVLSFSQVVLRNFFSTGFTWVDIGLRNMVLWVGFIGASLATRQDRHITIDALTRFLSPRGKAVAGVLTSTFALGVSGVFIWASLRFVAVEYQAQGIAFLNVPFWVLQLIIPGGFFFIGVRFLIKLIEDIDYLMTHLKGNR